MKDLLIFRHAPQEGPGYFATFLDEHGISWRLIAIDQGEPIPSHATDFAGLVFMGGPMSVNDPLPWVTQSIALIRDALSQNIPVLGHCLGGQLLAKALGAQVGPNRVKEIGWGAVTVSPAALAQDWLGDMAHFDAFHWHGETFTLPPGAQHLLSSAYCAQQGFVLGPHLGLQCHVEMTPDLVRAWCTAWDAEQVPAGPSVQTPQAIVEHLEERIAALHVPARRLYERWCAGCGL
jgi:GMP synthase-like glutamine amidotransferase